MNILKYNQYEKINEGVKEWILVLFLLLNIPIKSNTYEKNPPPKDKYFLKTIKKTFTEDDIEEEKSFLDKMLRLGWNKTTMEIDTIWNEIEVMKPDSNVYTLSLKFDNEIFFNLGKFGISNNIKDSISSSLEQLIKNEGILTKINIVSSTDKTTVSNRLQKKLIELNYTPDNDGLSKARSDSFIDYLSNDLIVNGKRTPINNDIIGVVNLSEQGGYDDQEARYVYVDIEFIKITKESKSEYIREPEIRKTYYFSKRIKNKKDINFNIPEVNIKIFKRNIKKKKCNGCSPW